jgi:hypothetical protein
MICFIIIVIITFCVIIGHNSDYDSDQGEWN